MSDLLKKFRADPEHLVYDPERKTGIIFNFGDVLECGCMGICGIINKIL